MEIRLQFDLQEVRKELVLHMKKRPHRLAVQPSIRRRAARAKELVPALACAEADSAVPAGTNHVRSRSGGTLPIVSIVIPCFNQGAFLSDAVISAANSAMVAYEIVIVNDGSSDFETLAQLEQIGLQKHVTVVDQKNLGLAAARRTGLAAARGQYIQLLDADDLICPGKIDLQVAHLRQCSLDVSISGYATCDESKWTYSIGSESITGFAFSLEDVALYWERGFSIPIHCALFNRRVFDSVNFIAGMRAKEDWIFWTDLFASDFRVGYIDLPLAIYRMHGENMTRDLSAMASSWVTAAYHIEAQHGYRVQGIWERAMSWFQEFYVSKSNIGSEAVIRNLLAEAAIRGDDPKAFGRPPHSETSATWRVRHKQVPTECLKDPPLLAPATISPVETAETVKYGIVIPVFNHKMYLSQCVISACSQEASSLRVYALNDGSTDADVGELLRDLSSRFPNLTVLEHSENCGISRTQNDLVTGCDAQYIAFLDCDDHLAAGAINTLDEWVSRDPDVDYWFSDRFDTLPSGWVSRQVCPWDVRPHFVFGQPRAAAERLLFGMFASHLKVIKKSAIIGAGMFDEALSGVQDWDLALKISESGRLGHVPVSLYFHRIHEQSVTASKSTQMIRRTNVARRSAQVRRALTQRQQDLRSSMLLELGSVSSFIAFLETGQVPAGVLPIRSGQTAGGQLMPIEFYSGSSAYNLVPADQNLAADDLVNLAREAPRALNVCLVPRERPQIMMHFLRDFNSLFDMIICDNLLDPPSIQSYCYDSSIVLTTISARLAIS